MMDTPIFAVKVSERWYIATQVDASAYGLIDPQGRKAWSDDADTAFLCWVGEEKIRICLDPGVRG